ncbi:MAG: hypothetical protein GY928_20850, partial [Colwellia sp.]|nr:hypothetical protein [Colwellia sp.]
MINKISDVYTEAFAQNKWISIDPHLINSTWIVEILNPDQIRNADITNQIIGSE